MKLVAAALGLAWAVTGASPREEALENDFVRVTVDPRKGGAVTSMAYRKATTFPLIADKGAGVAGRGVFFAPLLDGAELAAPEAKAEVRQEGGDALLTVTAALPDGVTFRRTFRLGRDESGFRFTDEWSSARERAARIGSVSRQEAEAWRLTARTGCGDAARAVLRNLPGGSRDAFESKAAPPFWRMIGPYGVGFLLQVHAPASGAKVALDVPKGAGGAAEWRWDSAVSLAPGAGVAVEGAVLIDEGGREGNGPVPWPKADRVGVTLDVRAGARAGETVPGFATVVSAVRRTVSLSVTETAEGGPPREIHRARLTLEPGRGKIVPFDVTPSRKGTCAVSASIAGEDGAVLAASSAPVVVDGEGPVWENFQKKIPTSTYRGTWAEIGAQLAKAGRLKARAADARAAERRAFYEKHFPHYAELIKGAAEALKVTPEQLAGVEPAPASEACMDVFFNGPDGPINAFSKERSGGGMGGLAYMKVIPDRGYAYHVYECGSWQNGYGVNSEGLATSGASINCDAQTTAAGRKFTQEWKAAAKMVAPLGSHMMLATCKNVDEAVAFIESPLAPFEFEGNMLLVDRAGNAARLESVGIRRQIHRYDPKRDRFFVAGNYPHGDREGGFAVGPDWGWAANTMLRERLLEELAGSRLGQISLKEAFRLMETHAAGGMCQHLYDNVGRLQTSNSFLAVCRTSDLWLSQGPPCRVRYYRFTLAD